MFDYEAADKAADRSHEETAPSSAKGRLGEGVPHRCPPILWFGNARSPKPKVLTIGANPSCWEYLDDSCRRALERRNGDEFLLCYLDRESPGFGFSTNPASPLKES